MALLPLNHKAQHYVYGHDCLMHQLKQTDSKDLQNIIIRVSDTA